MTQPVFQGRWRLEPHCSEAVFSRRFSVQGSDNADGHYVPAPPHTPTLVVDGASWSVTLERIRGDLGGGEFIWRAERVSPATRFTPDAGLVIVLASPEVPGLSVTCTCLDPALGYTPVPKPFDFTRPDG